jgi:hypothetical protein
VYRGESGVISKAGAGGGGAVGCFVVSGCICFKYWSFSSFLTWTDRVVLGLFDGIAGALLLGVKGYKKIDYSRLKIHFF